VNTIGIPKNLRGLKDFFESSMFKNKSDGTWLTNECLGNIEYLTDTFVILLAYEFDYPEVWQVDVGTTTGDFPEGSEYVDDDYLAFGLYTDEEFKKDILPLLEKYGVAFTDDKYKEYRIQQYKQEVVK